MRNYEDLLVWQRGMKLIAECYRVSGRFPRSEQFGLTNQLRRASISVAANIAEGNGRAHRKEYLHFLSVTNGSLNEVKTYLSVSRMLEYASAEDLKVARGFAAEVGRLLTALRRSLS